MKPRVAVSILKVIEHMASNTKEAASVHEEFLKNTNVWGLCCLKFRDRWRLFVAWQNMFVMN